MAHTEKDRREKRIPVKNIVKRAARGSTVVEMSYIIPMFLGLFVLIMHAVFYYHDKAVLNGAASETAILGVQAERRADETEDNPESFDRKTGRKYSAYELMLKCKERERLCVNM